MTEIEIKSIEHLFENVKTIQKKHEDFAEVTGGNYNVFKILGVTTSELSHSSIISNLLNKNGSHGQKDLFLKQFIVLLNEKYRNLVDVRLKNNEFKDDKINLTLKYLSNFETTISKSMVEYSLGTIDHAKAIGGFIDILVSAHEKNIIIENKIYAIDQPIQLLRYKNYDSNAPVVYLTLFPKSPSGDSIGEKHSQETLKEGDDFINVSYSEDIIKWLKTCLKEIYDKPFLRETLTQYLNTINFLTNQSNNNEMSKDIATTIMSNSAYFKSFEEIIKTKDIVYDELIERFKCSMVTLLEEYDSGLNLNTFSLKKGVKYSGFTIQSADLNIKKLNIRVEEENEKFYIGFVRSSDTNKDDFQELRSIFIDSDYMKVKQSPSWPAYSDLKECNTWQDFFNSVINGKMEEIIKLNLDKMLVIFYKAYPDLIP